MKKIALMIGLLCAGWSRAENMPQAWMDVTIQHSERDITVSRSEDLPALRTRFRMGDRAAAHIQILKADGKRQTILLQNKTDGYTVRKKQNGKTVSETITLPDAAVRFHPFVTRHVRPYLRRYTDSQKQAWSNRWEHLTAASQHVFTLELHQTGDFFEYYLDGSYIGRTAGVFEALVFRLSAAGAVISAQAGTPYASERFRPLEMRWMARPGIFSNAVPSLQAGLQRLAGIPMVVASGPHSGDVGQVRQMKGSWALECDEQLARTALDGMPESLHVAVPPTTFTRAWVLCAVDPDAQRDPIVTVRMTRYAKSGRGEAIGIDTVTLPRTPAEPLPERVQRMGSVMLKGTNLPLYLLEMDLDPGAILDLLAMQTDNHASMMRAPYIDIDFMGKPGRLGAQWDRSRKPDNKSVSSVHLFGVTLEKMPVSIRFEQTQPGNIFHNNERPETHVYVRAQAEQVQARLNWSVSDAGGRECWSESKPLAFAKDGAEQHIVVPLEVSDIGWYGLNFEITDRDGRVLLKHAASFAVLGKDTRQAGYESPFGTWWFGGAHYAVDDPAIAGPLLFKAGLRKTTFSWSKFSEEDFAPWKVTLNQIGWNVRPSSITNQEAAYLELEEKIAPLVKRFPHCDAATIFHESYSSRLPPELIGEETVETPQQIERARKMAELGNFMGAFYREKFPQIKLLVGNTTHSGTILSALLRHGMQPQYIDAIGMETVGQTAMPERLWAGGLQGIWIGRETVRRLGYDFPVDGCYEFTTRADRTLGQQGQAEFYVRDILISLAYGFEHVTPGIIMDAGNAYGNSYWGAGGICRRYPLLYPKKAYVGMATLTRVLDRAAFVGKHATGSSTVYAIAFDRADGRKVTALWTTVGEADVEIAFAERTAVKRVGFFGATKSDRMHQQTVTVGTAPIYLISEKSLQTVRVRSRRYAPPADSFRVADSMSATNHWVLDSGHPRMNRHNPDLPLRELGTFTLTAVDDDQKGASLELALVKEGTREALISEYTYLKAVEPIAVPEKPTDIGLWVKGDSGWGKIVFAILDANNRTWCTEGRWHDWPGDLSVNFDGWRFMSYPIDGSSTALNISPSKRWGPGSGVPAFPIRIAGIYVVVNRQALGLTKMREVPGVLRFKDMGVVYGK